MRVGIFGGDFISYGGSASQCDMNDYLKKKVLKRCEPFSLKLIVRESLTHDSYMVDAKTLEDFVKYYNIRQISVAICSYNAQKVFHSLRPLFLSNKSPSILLSGHITDELVEKMKELLSQNTSFTSFSFYFLAFQSEKGMKTFLNSVSDRCTGWLGICHMSCGSGYKNNNFFYGALNKLSLSVLFKYFPKCSRLFVIEGFSWENLAEWLKNHVLKGFRTSKQITLSQDDIDMLPFDLNELDICCLDLPNNCLDISKFIHLRHLVCDTFIFDSNNRQLESVKLDMKGLTAPPKNVSSVNAKRVCLYVKHEHIAHFIQIKNINHLKIYNLATPHRSSISGSIILGLIKILEETPSLKSLSLPLCSISSNDVELLVKHPNLERVVGSELFPFYSYDRSAQLIATNGKFTQFLHNDNKVQEICSRHKKVLIPLIQKIIITFYCERKRKESFFFQFPKDIMDVLMKLIWETRREATTWLTYRNVLNME